MLESKEIEYSYSIIGFKLKDINTANIPRGELTERTNLGFANTFERALEMQTNYLHNKRLVWILSKSNRP